MNLLRQLYELSPREWVRKVHTRLRPHKNDGPALEETLSSSKYTRSQRLYDFLSRYEAVIAKHRPWTPIDFKERNVVELGAGPVLGWAPLAVFLGCARFTCVEPFYNPAIIEAPSFIRRYLLYIHKDLSALYSRRMTFEEFLTYLHERVHVVRKEFLEADTDVPFEVALSNSCLEHIFPLDETIARLKSLSAPACRFIHVVDFGNHLKSEHPFNEIYTVEPEAFFAKHGKKINLLRGPDILRIFRDVGFDASLVPYYYHREFYQQAPIPYWTRRYSEEDLFLKCGIFTDTVDG